jgi:tRNA U34 2-thiouridine synthase MnmA/TrmU
VKCRYRQPFVRAIFDLNNNILQLKDKVKGVALGQSAVFYFKDIVLGGGIIYKKE